MWARTRLRQFAGPALRSSAASCGWRRGSPPYLFRCGWCWATERRTAAQFLACPTCDAPTLTPTGPEG